VKPSALAEVMLLVQAAIAGLVVAEELLVGAVSHSPIVLAIAALSAVAAGLPVLVAAGMAAGWHWAPPLGLGLELLLLISGATNGIVLGNNDLVSLLVTVMIPALVIHQLLTSRPTPSPASGERDVHSLAG
jgi:hypothetical protein